MENMILLQSVPESQMNFLVVLILKLVQPTFLLNMSSISWMFNEHLSQALSKVQIE